MPLFKGFITVSYLLHELHCPLHVSQSVRMHEVISPPQQQLA